jgi:anti-sigma factor RsiW
MNDCHHYQSQMLEHLYGLLDEADARGLLDHLARCEACHASLDRARGQQRLLASAARNPFPAVRFETPAGEPAAEPVLPIREAPARPRRRWVGWAAAAAALLALGSLGIPAAWYGRDYARARDAVAAHAAALDAARQEARAAEQQLNQLPIEENRKAAEVMRAARERQLNVVVSGPERLQAGAPGEYRVQTRNLVGAPVPAQVDVRVVDQQKGKALFEQKGVKVSGDHRFTLPPDLELRPDTLLALEVTARREGDDDASSTLREQLELAAPVYVTHLATDKPIYQPGETVYFRSLTLDRFGLKPPSQDFRLVYTVTTPGNDRIDVAQGASRLVKSPPRPGAVLGPDGQPVRGVGSGAWKLDPDAEGGEYTLTVREANDRFPPQVRKFVVNRYQPGPFNKELNFDRSSYGPGDTVVARCKATRAADNSPLAGKPVRGAVYIDGQHYRADGTPGSGDLVLKTGPEGTVDVAFKLPAKIEKGQGSLTVTFYDGSTPDPIVRTIPIVLKKLQVDFYPEGGDLVEGLEGRVYFQVRTTLDKPGDLNGRLVDDTGKVVVADVRTLSDAERPGVNQGMGVFAFTPEPGRKYELKIDAPIGVQSKHELPKAKAGGVALSVPDGVTGPKDAIRVRVRSAGADRSLLVGAYCRGRLLDHRPVTVKKGETAEVTLEPAGGVGGVCRVTAFEEQAAGGQRRQLVPVAERLVYREPGDRLKLEVEADKKNYIPGDRVTLTVRARDEQERATGAVVLLHVVDKRVIALADEKTARSMPTHYLLTTEVRRPEDLEHADFLLSGHEQARAALDLLLGTQGWRRFAEQDPARFRQEHKEDANRLLVTIGQASPKVTDFAARQAAEVHEEYAARREKVQEEHAAAVAAVGTLDDDDAAKGAAAKVRWYEDRLEKARRYGVPALGVVLLLVVVGSVLLGFPRSFRRAVPYYAAVTACAAVLMAVAFFARMKETSRESSQVALAENARREALEDRAGAEMQRENAAMAMDQAFGGAGGPPPAGGVMAPAAPAPRMPAEMDAGKGEAKAAPREDGGFAGGREARDRQQGRDKAAGWKAGDEAFRKDRRAADGVREMAKQPARGPLGGGFPGRGGAGGMVPPPGAMGGRGGGFAMPAPPPPPMVVREYAHAYRPGEDPVVRTDFAETLLWQPVLVVPADGKAQVSFELCDSVTAFEVTAFGHTLDGRLGAATGQVESRLPFTLDPKTPIEVTASDRIDLPVNVINTTTEGRVVRLSAAARNLKLLSGNSDGELQVAGKEMARRLYRFQPDVVEGEARVEFRGQAVPFAADGVARTFRVVPDGFPVVASRSDLLEGVARHEVVLPATWVKGTLKCQVQVYPSTLASLEKGLESLLREPNGCFEQTSTTNYPNVLILDYLRESDQVRPEVEARARDLMSRGYQKLMSFECPQTAKSTKQGYEWFGAPNAAHEALTAYGLMQFRDMARVHKVDPAMVERTREYLLASRDGKGGFTRNPRALDTFGRAPGPITDAYIVWSLTEGGDDDVTAELNALASQAKTSKDAYFLSLVANGLLNRGRSDEAVALLKAVAGLQKPDGHLDAEKTSITGSGGRDLQVETTALAVLGWLKANRPAEFNAPVQNAVKWIGQQRGGHGGFGATQATILALKALIAYTRANKKTPESGELSLFVGEQRVGHLKFPAGAQDVLAIELPEPEKYLKPGANAVRAEITGKNAFPYTLSWSYQTLQPPSDESCAVRLTTALDRAEAEEGQTLHLNVTVENATDKGHGMAVAVIGLPAGLSLPDDLKQLKEHARLRENETKPGLISTFEVRGRELVLYWRDLAPRQKIEVPVDLVCRVPGEYRGPASRSYLYYNADAKWWVEPLAVKVAAK